MKLARSREQAHDLIYSNKVLVNGSVALKPSRQVTTSDDIRITSPVNEGFVSRGGVKLEFALNNFGIDPNSLRCLDAGASTGGFTHCLLNKGAGEVVAVDVGYRQLHEKLAKDNRVSVVDRTNVRYLDESLLGSRPFDLAVCDLSFISLRILVPVFTGSMLKSNSCLVLLVKPQFEAGRKVVSQGKGIVKDPLVHKSVLMDVSNAYIDAGCSMEGVAPSPIKGAKGNIEYFLHLHNGAGSNGCSRLSAHAQARIQAHAPEYKLERSPACNQHYSQEHVQQYNPGHVIADAIKEAYDKWLV